MTGPLHGLHVIEIAGTAAGAFTATLLGDLGADVIRVDRPATAPAAPGDPLARGRRRVTADLKDPAGVAEILDLVAHADILVEGFRPGVAERLGIGPQQCHARNPRLIYGRVSGWGQDGPWAQRPGHDITFLAVTGALADAAEPPPYYLSSFAGGGMTLALGLLAAVWERGDTGPGQVVDTAMVEGTALLTGLVQRWRETPGLQTFTSAPFYTTYACADGRRIAVGAIEDKFYRTLTETLGLDDLPPRDDRASWPELTRLLADTFRTRDRDDWTKVFADTDACVVPVLTLDEAADHPQAAARRAYPSVGGVRQPAPAPRFSRTPTATPAPISW
ncbi:CaiB/BaiF CoA-transferase family protein [Winogradskya consettensis]|uniref:CoA transferase n=1 Tax=Winogradskya consettensis TaxID=113560 RepID=A0A919VSY9_9ACTN|nr:CaiB/BaiF CoA-transferase family protein [Actinoplanes consettensis]GIM68328.1 CoA transferase [Actinoplanes consettensis]